MTDMNTTAAAETAFEAYREVNDLHPAGSLSHEEARKHNNGDTPGTKPWRPAAEIIETYSNSLRCPYCDHPFLLQNSLGIFSQQDPCAHLVVFDPVFSTRIRISESDFKVFEGILFERILDELFGEVTVVHHTKPDERLFDEGWTAAYHGRPEEIVPHLSEQFGP